MTAALIVYVAGVAAGLARTDAPLPERLAIALLWPLGVAAFAVTMAGLLALGAVTAPMVGAALAGAAVAGWLILR